MQESSSPELEAARPNRRQAAKIRTRAKVLAAARALFAERGYDAATIRDIAREAGMSTGAVFANFQDKAELFEAVFSEELEAVLESFRTEAATHGAVADRLAEAMNAGYHRSLQHLPLMQAMIARSWFQPEAADQRGRAAVRPIIETILGVVHDGVGAGELRQDLDMALLGRMIWDVWVSNFRYAAFDGWTLEQLAPHARKQIDLILASQLAR